MAASDDPTMRSIHRMLNPGSIAVVGATSRPQYGGRFLQAALRASDRVKVYPVNPRYEELMGMRCYQSLAELPESPDLVGIIVPYDRVMGTLEECVVKGAGSAIVISAGFAERGTQDRRDLQREIGDLARQSGLRVSGPNCLGLANVKADIWACSSSLGTQALPGPIALVSQSGATAFGPFLTRAMDRGIGYSYVISTGNEADLESSDFIRYLVDDAQTRVIACFIEGFKDGRKFLEVSRLAQERGKPIVMFKVGRSDLGSRAAGSHTAALTGSDAVHEGIFRQYGVIRVEDYDALLEVSQLLAFSPAPEVDGVSIVSHSGGICSLTADKCGQAGLCLPDLREETQAELNGVLKGFGWAANPSDVTNLANSESFPRIMELMITEPGVGAFVVASAMGDGQARQVIELRDKSHDKAIAFLWTGSQSATEGLNLLQEANVPVFYQPEGLARGLKGMLDYYRQRRTLQQDGPVHAVAVSAERNEEQRAFLSVARGAVTEHEAKGLLSCWGIPVTRERRAVTWEETFAAADEIGYPVVLKIESPDILHKTDAGLVWLGILDEDELRRAYDTVTSTSQSRFPEASITGVLVQEMVEGGTEVIVGVSRDPHFGPVLMFGMGGIFVEVYNDVALRACPISRRDALEMVQEVKGARLLGGYRGRPPADIDALVDVFLRTSQMATDLEDVLTELDINPLTVLAEGKGVRALDALAVLGG